MSEVGLGGTQYIKDCVLHRCRLPVFVARRLSLETKVESDAAISSCEKGSKRDWALELCRNQMRDSRTIIGPALSCRF